VAVEVADVVVAAASCISALILSCVWVVSALGGGAAHMAMAEVEGEGTTDGILISLLLLLNQRASRC